MNANFEDVTGLYLHIPFCSGKCFYCAFYSIPISDARATCHADPPTGGEESLPQPSMRRRSIRFAQDDRKDLAWRYLQAVQSELQHYAPLKVQTVYFGGGTPSLLSPSELDHLCAAVKKNIDMANLKEWTFEANPESLTADKLAVLKKNGVNRISLGAQSFDDLALQWLGRRHNAAQIMEAAKLIRATGFQNFGLDLIACIPGFADKVWKKTLTSAVKLNPTHISVYALTIEEGSKLARIKDTAAKNCSRPRRGRKIAASAPDYNSVYRHQANLLSEDEELAALDLAEKILTSEGFHRYEISNYAKPGHECLHNLSCWRGEEYLGLGPAAASHVNAERKTNLPDLEKYIETVENGRPPSCMIDPANKRTRQLEKVVFGLRMSEGVPEQDANQWQARMHALRKNGLLNFSGGRWRLTEQGRNLADYVGAELLAGEDGKGISE